MKKFFLLGLFIPCCLMGCASVNLEDTRGYTRFSSFVRDLGEPVSSSKLDTGETLHTFFKQCTSAPVIQKMEVLELNDTIYKVQVTNECPKPVEEYILEHGMPTLQYNLPNGNTAYSFNKMCEYDRTREEETIVIVGEDNLIKNISTPSQCPSYYDSPRYKMQRKQEKREERLREKRNDIAGELLNMGTEERQKLNMMSAETKAIYAESKKKAGMPLTAQEEQQIKTAEQARQDFANWKKRHDELRAQLEALR